MKKRITALLLCLVMALSLIPTSAWAAESGIGTKALVSNETQKVRYKILYISDEYNLGYNYGKEENREYTCQYSEGHSGYNHSIAEKDIKAAAAELSVKWGETFSGWGKGKGDQNTRVYPFKDSGTTATQTTYTIWLVVKKSVPAPTDTDIKNIQNAVFVDCTTDNGHDNYTTIKGTLGSDYTVSGSGKNRTVTIKNVSAYYPTEHGKDTDQTDKTTVELVYANGAWTLAANGAAHLYVKCEQTPPLDPPAKPTGDEVKTLLGNIVDVYCTVEQENNTNKLYGPYSLEDGTFTVGNVTGNATNGYTCTVTIDNVDNYTTKPAGHTTDGSKDAEMVKTITLTRSANATAWSVSNNGRFKLYAKCEQTPPLDPPTKPTDAEMQGILGVKVDCVATTQVKPAHSASSRKFIDGTYEVGEPLYDTARNLWYCAVTITKPEAYIPGYDSDLSTITSIMAGKQVKYLHELKVEGAVAAPTAKLIYTAKGWEVDGKGSLDAQFATINVICRPALPTIPELNQLGVDVNVSCATKDSKHTGKTYTLNTNKDVVTGTITMNSQGQYECVLKLRDDTAKAYVTDYSGTTNADKKTHTLKDNGSVTLVWGDNGWELKDQNAKTLIITATCTTDGGTNPGTKPGTNPGAKNPYVKDEGKKVESGKTFDAGIALYVGLGILSLTGSAAAIYKRREEY